MSRVRPLDERYLPDGDLTTETIDRVLDENSCRVSPSCVPNFALVSTAVEELYRNKDIVLAQIEDVYENTADLGPHEWLTSMSDCLSMHCPSLSSIIDVSMKNPEIFVNRNDYSSSPMGAFKVKSVDRVVTRPVVASPTYVPDYPATAANDSADAPLPTTPDWTLSPSEVEVIEHPGYDFAPTKVCTSYTPGEVGGYGDPILIHNYTYQDNNVAKASSYVSDPAKQVPIEKHKHPLRYALRNFSAVVFNSYHRGDKFIRVTGTSYEALRIKNLSGYNAYALHDVDLSGTRYADQYSRWKKLAGPFDKTKKYDLPIVFSSGEYIHCCAMRELELPRVIYYYPLADTTRLLRDNSNRALCYRPPVWSGDVIELSLWDKHHRVANYVLEHTPRGGNYGITPYTSLALKLPLSPEKLTLFGMEGSTLHFLKVGVTNRECREVAVPYRYFSTPWESSPNIRTIPTISPIDKNRNYVEYEGTPVMCHIQLRQCDIRVHITNLGNRAQCTVRRSDDMISGVLDCVTICFLKDGVLTHAGTLFTSTGNIWGVDTTLMDIYNSIGFFSYHETEYVKKRIFSSFKPDRWYYATDGCFSMLKGHWQSAVRHEEKDNVSIGLPLSHVRAGALAYNYFNPGSDMCTDLEVVLGIVDVEVKIDNNKY